MNEDELAEFLEQGPPPGRRVRPTRPNGRDERDGSPGAEGAGADGVRRLLGAEATWAEPTTEGADALFAAIRTELPTRPPTAGADPRRAVSRPSRGRPNAAPPAPGRPQDLTPARAWGLLAARSRAVAVGAVAGLVALGLLAGLALGGDGGAEGGDWASAPAWSLAGAAGAPDATGEVRARDTPSGLEIWLAVEGLPAAPAGTYYEAYVTGPNGRVSVGTFHVRDGDQPVILWSGVGFDAYPTFTVALEREGGDPAAEGQPVLTGDVGP